jgi:hypothetical protein
MGRYPPALATTNGTKAQPCDVERERPHDQAGTMIRHTRLGPTLPIVALTYPVRPSAGVRPTRHGWALHCYGEMKGLSTLPTASK